jgi:ABC-type bacteriocin/lantibiotic exporter with double-glycine peptidase domain
MSLIINFIKLLDNKQKITFYFILFLLLIASILETIGIAAILPLLAVIISGKEFFLQTEFLNNFPTILEILNSLTEKEIITYFLIAITLVFFFKNIFLIIFNYVKETFFFNLRKSFSQKIYSNLLKEDIKNTLKSNSGYFINIILNIVSDSINNVVVPFVFLLNEVLLIVFVFFFIFIVEPTSSLVVSVLFFIFLLLIYIFFNKKIKILGMKKIEYDTKQIKNLNEVFSMLKYLKILNKNKFFQNDFNLSNKKVNDISKIQTLYEIYPKYILEFFSVIILSVVIIILSYSKVSIQQVLPIIGLYTFAAIRLMPSVNKIISAIQKLRFGSSGYKTLLKFLKHKKNNFNYNTNYYEVKKSVSIKNLFFSYGNELILENVNLNISIGETVGILGKTGSGKTTLIDLFAGILEPTSGSVMYDSLSRATAKNLKLKIGYVPQSVYLLDNTLINNVTLDPENCNFKSLEKAIYASCLNSFVGKNNKGLKRLLGENASKISGGQKQRVGIARALYNNPQFLILDEATNALDKKTEKVLLSRIRKLYKNLTIIIISHNEKLLDFCSAIYEVKNKKIKKRLK